jgi:NAD(P)-dependent dehydrogenase (short-subunit alcohol dehydrogenase family)
MRSILITGGTGKIGSVLVKCMVQDGHQVVFTTRSKKSGYEMIDKFNLKIENCTPIELDFSKADALKNLRSQIKHLPDTLIHNARSLETLRLKKNGRINSEQFQTEFFNGITFPYHINNLMLDLKAPLRDVLFISSIYGNVSPNPSLYENFELESPVNYGVTKAAQIHLVKELAVRLSPKKIRVNAISYGGVEGRVDNEFKKRYRKLTPLGGMLENKDLYPPVKYLLDNYDLKVTGENLKVDGGWTIW